MAGVAEIEEDGKYIRRALNRLSCNKYNKKAGYNLIIDLKNIINEYNMTDIEIGGARSGHILSRGFFKFRDKYTEITNLHQEELMKLKNATKEKAEDHGRINE